METQRFFELLVANVKSDVTFDCMRKCDNAYVLAGLYVSGDVQGYIFSSFERAYEELQKSYDNANSVYEFYMIIPLKSHLFD